MQKQTFSAEELGNEYATGISRPAVLTTKTFLPHQRVTTEGKAMEFKKGDVVTWSSQAAGSWKTKTGVITEVWEYKKQTRYTVKVDPREGSTAKPKFYYPRTSALQKVS
ncbi:hypothetical protein RNP97_000169 [Enterobacter bugandensis]|uniref:hypothetical protein n=1 Tax=Enterobacter TaxID=547 RepID=UPI001419DC5D|nr:MULTISPECIES: hypothetical protein [Enterobacter]ELF8869853.1 hypothetical protein [Enterobacter bugandensis]ELQ3992596.1 hypothetical protein [Enterobacter bugandensis]ELV3038625.1 hypothetical protein [Enterobacter bugandensis]ELX8410740.1 hypothetical protein [Enterobacter bugandensis]MDX7622932.1 hypothetical protein [Enterobacter bugandensis]